MSLKSMLRHRGDLMLLEEGFVNGTPVHQWTVVKKNVRCFVDLNFVRLGKDPTWTPEAGRPTKRSGVGFFLSSAPLVPGMRVRMTKGPKGTFAIGGAVDEAWKPERLHHLEVGLEEVPGQVSRGELA